MVGAGEYEQSMSVMVGVLVTMRDERDRQKIADAIDKAYPFTSRAGAAYKAWLSARKDFFPAHSLPMKYQRKNKYQIELDLRPALGPLDAGSILSDAKGQARVMAVADGYVMARRPGCAPFVLRVSEIALGKWERVR